MNSTEKLTQKRAKRREKNSEVRQALLINEYVYKKHFAVYQEAASFYNNLNSKYPLKPDLRRTDEFRAFKMGISYRTMKNTGKYVKQYHQPIPTTHGDSFTQVCEQATNPQQQNNEGDEPVSRKKSVNQQKVMQLEIPLLKPSVITQTVQIITDEVLQENPLQVAAEEVVQESTTIYPSLDEEIPDEILERIVSELREDPELRTIMTDIEKDIEFEQLGMDIEIPEDDRLENELNCEFF